MPIPIISIAQMREWEAATWATGLKEAEVIRRVGRAVAGRAIELTRPNDFILILAGKGHNGNDARAAAAHLAERDCEVVEVTSPERDSARFEAALAKKPGLVIDGLFGIGLDRPLDAMWVKFINRVNETKLLVLSVDVPSGLNADTGEPQGAAIEAAVTITVGAPKVGLLKEAAWPFVGRLELADDVGFAPCPHQTELQWTQSQDFADFPPRRPSAGHKGTFGHLAIIAGSKGYHGAAVLAARGAQRAQPGLISVFTLEAAYQPVASQLQAVMVNTWNPSLALTEGYSAVLMGPGLASPDAPEDMKLAARKLWRELPGPMIVDASALAWLPQEPPPRNAIRVVTPHPGEAARLLGTETKQVQADRVKALRGISSRYSNCWVVLKGQQTLIGRSSGEIFVNSSGNPHLAQGGSGDTLGGFIGGLLAQSALQNDTVKALRYAVWEHGAAADRLQNRQPNWVLEELVTELGNSPHGAAHLAP